MFQTSGASSLPSCELIATFSVDLINVLDNKIFQIRSINYLLAYIGIIYKPSWLSIVSTMDISYRKLCITRLGIYGRILVR